jgi:hypothetical protein
MPKGYPTPIMPGHVFDLISFLDEPKLLCWAGIWECECGQRFSVMSWCKTAAAPQARKKMRRHWTKIDPKWGEK